MDARYYDPEIGQFLGCPQGADTLVPDPGKLFAYNRYMYGYGNPLRFTDPTGHGPCDNGNRNCQESLPVVASPLIPLPVALALYESFAHFPASGSYTWDVFYNDLTQAVESAGGFNLETYRTVSNNLAQAYTSRYGDTGGDAEAAFFVLFGSDELLEATAQTENKRVGELVGVLTGMGPNVGLPRFNGAKPRYTVNPEHVPNSGHYRPWKTPLPADAEAVYARAVPGDPQNPRTWWGLNAEGQIYRYSYDNAGGAYFSGIVGVGDGVRNFTPYAKQRLGVE